MVSFHGVTHVHDQDISINTVVNEQYRYCDDGPEAFVICKVSAPCSLSP